MAKKPVAVPVAVPVWTPDVDLLKSLAAEGGWIDGADENVRVHIANGYAQTDGELDGDGDYYVELTEIGKQAAIEAGWTAAPRVAAVVAREAAPRFDNISSEVDDDAPELRSTRLRGKKSNLREALGFDELEIGQSRHIAVTDTIPSPWKSYGSTVSLENKRYASPKYEDGLQVTVIRKTADGPKRYPVYTYTKKFTIYRAGANDPRGPGARLKRIDPNK